MKLERARNRNQGEFGHSDVGGSDGMRAIKVTVRDA